MGLWVKRNCFSDVFWLYEKGLLLVGDTPSKFKSRNDKTAWPLFGDAGTATAIEYNSSADNMFLLFQPMVTLIRL